MATEHSPKGHRQGERYEKRDANIRSLLQFAFWLFLVLVIVLLGMKWTFSYFAKSQPLGPPASPFENARVLPPQPRLQPEPRADLKNYCETQEQQLNSYGWVDQHNQVVRIPIDRAMDLVLQRGLPARPPGEPPANLPPAMTAEASKAPPAIGEQGPCSYFPGPSASEGSKYR